MDTSAAATADMGTAAFVKQEPGIAEEQQHQLVGGDGHDDGSVRKMTVLGPLRTKLLERQDTPRRSSSASMQPSFIEPASAAEEEQRRKAQPPASTPASVPATSENATATSSASALPPEQTEPKPPPVAAKAAPVPFRRKKVIPVAIARKIAQKDKSNNNNSSSNQTSAELPVDSHVDRGVQEQNADSKPSQMAVEEKLESGSATAEKTESAAAAATVPRPSAFRRIKPKVSININQVRPRKSILKKSSNEPSKSNADLTSTMVVLDDPADDPEEDAEDVERRKFNEERRRRQEEEEKLRRQDEEEILLHQREAEEKRRQLDEEEKRRRQEEKEKRRRQEEEEEKRRRQEEEEKRRRQEEEEKRRQQEAEEKHLQQLEEEVKRRRQEAEEKHLQQLEEEEKRRRQEAEEAEKRRRQKEEEEKEKRRRQVEMEEEKRREELHRERMEKQAEEERTQNAIEKPRIEAGDQKDNKDDQSKPEAIVKAPEAKKVLSRRSMKMIPAEVWKTQLQLMRTNPCRMHSAVESTERSVELPPVQPESRKESVIVENSSSSVIVTPEEPANSDIASAENTKAVVPTKQIRRISKLPPSVAMKLMKCVAAGSATQKEPEQPDKGKRVEPETSTPVVEPANPIKTIRRISRLPANVAQQVIESVQQPERPPVVEVKEVAKEIAQAPRVTPIPENVPSITPESVVTNNSFSGAEKCAEKAVENKEQSKPSVEQANQTKPIKQIRRIAQLPAAVAMKLVNSLKEVKAPVQTPDVSNISMPLAPNSRTSSATLSDMKPESAEPDVKTSKGKVHILSQVILPSASYNLEKLLAGKSTQELHTADSSMLLMPRSSEKQSPAIVTDGSNGKVERASAEFSAKNLHGNSHQPPNQTIEPSMEDGNSQSESDCDDGRGHTSDDGSQYDGGEKQRGYSVPANDTQPVQTPVVQAVDQKRPVMLPEAHQIPSTQQQRQYASNVPAVSQPQLLFQTQYPIAPVDFQQNTQIRVNNFHVAPSQPQHQMPVVFRQNLPPRTITYQPSQVPQIARHNQQANQPPVQPQRVLLGQAGFSQAQAPIQRHAYNATQIVLIRNTSPAMPAASYPQQQIRPQPRHRLIVPQSNYYSQELGQTQIIVPTPRFLLTPAATVSSPVTSHLQVPQPQQPQLKSARYVIPTISPQKRAFQPVEQTAVPTQYHSNAPQMSRVIPKIVIDSSSCVEAETERNHQNTTPESPKDLQNFSPCSQAIKDKLREKLRAKMFQKNKAAEPPTPAPSALPPTPVNTQLNLSTTQPASEVKAPPNHAVHHHPPPVCMSSKPTMRQPLVYHRDDFQQHRPQTIRIAPQEHRQPIKQYIYGQGRKIYLTKISVVKPPELSTTSTPTLASSTVPISSQQSVVINQQSTSATQLHTDSGRKPQLQYDGAFLGFPQSTIKSELRVFKQFCASMQQLEQKVSPEPPPRSRPSIESSVTTAEQETFIITELNPPNEQQQQQQPVEEERPRLPDRTVIKQEDGGGGGVLPRITMRRKTFVVSDSDDEVIGGRELPCIEEATAAEANIRVKQEDGGQEKSGAAPWMAIKKEEKESSSASESEADEDLAREILAMVQRERQYLGMSARDSPPRERKKTKRKRKRKKRCRRERGNTQLVDLLMKHVNQESLIADMVATQRKSLLCIELSDSEEEKREDPVASGGVSEDTKAASDAQEDPPKSRSPEGSNIEENVESSDDDIFAQILEPFKGGGSIEDGSASDETGGPSPIPPEPVYESSTEEKDEEEEVRKIVTAQPEASVPNHKPSEIFCDTSALSAAAEAAATEHLKPASIALRATKTRLRPILVSRTKNTPTETRNRTVFDTLKQTTIKTSKLAPSELTEVEDSSDPFSDRDDVGIVPQVEAVKPSVLEDSKDVPQSKPAKSAVEANVTIPSILENSMKEVSQRKPVNKTVGAYNTGTSVLADSTDLAHSKPAKRTVEANVTIPSIMENSATEVSPSKPAKRTVEANVTGTLITEDSTDVAHSKPAKRIVEEIAEEWASEDDSPPLGDSVADEKPAIPQYLLHFAVPAVNSSVDRSSKPILPMLPPPAPVQSIAKTNDVTEPKRNEPVQQHQEIVKTVESKPGQKANEKQPKAAGFSELMKPKKPKKTHASEDQSIRETKTRSVTTGSESRLETESQPEQPANTSPKVDSSLLSQSKEQAQRASELEVPQSPKAYHEPLDISIQEKPFINENHSSVSNKQPSPQKSSPQSGGANLVARVLIDRIDTDRYSMPVSKQSPPIVESKKLSPNETNTRSLRSRPLCDSVVPFERPSKRPRIQKRATPDNSVSKDTIEPSAAKAPEKEVDLSERKAVVAAHSPPEVPSTSKRNLRSRTKSVFREISDAQDPVQQSPSRTLRNRTISTYVENPPAVVVEPKKQSTSHQSEPPPKQAAETPAEQSAENGNQVAKLDEEAGGKADAVGNKQTPVIFNHIPIPISSEDEDDTPLVKRRKVLRKKRSTNRSSHTLRDLNANRRLFQSAYKHSSSADLAASGFDDPLQYNVVKTEPPEELEECDPSAQVVEQTAASKPAESSGRLLSIVTVRNNQVVEEEQFDETSPNNQGNAKQYVSKNLIQPPSAPAEHVFATPETVKPAKRKRRSKAEIEVERQAKQQRREIKHVQPIIPDSDVEEDVECGNCGQLVAAANWESHYASHNGLTYRNGIDPEFDLYDEKSAAQAVTRYMHTYRQVQVKCERCSVVKKSALGLVSHRTVCGMTPEEMELSKIPCVHCKRKLMPVSMSTHLAGHCSVLKKMKKQQQEAELAMMESEEAGVTKLLNQRGLVKRKATTRAEKNIQNLVCNEHIFTVTKGTVTDGCLAAWKTQFRKAKTAKCIFATCDFMGSEEVEMRHHHEFCPSPCVLYECRNCKYQSQKMELVAKHVKMKHVDILAAANVYESSGTEAKISSESSDDENGVSGVDENSIVDDSAADDMSAGKPKKTKKKADKLLIKSSAKDDSITDDYDVYKDMILDEARETRALKGEFYRITRGWMRAFRENHYNLNTMLFRELKPDLDVRFLAFDLLQDYIPKSDQSVRFTMRNTNYYNAPIDVNGYTDRWRRLSAFSGLAEGTDSMFFCGGPVVALDWLPLKETDETQEHQILAVACKREFDEYHKVERIEPSKCLIQIWDVGPLLNKNLNKKVSLSVPELLYSIACDFGPIWALKFCPSGCFNSVAEQDSYDRLGLLAAAGSDGDVYIYSLGKNMDTKILNHSRIVCLNPVLRLTLSLLDTKFLCEYEDRSALKVVWSKCKGHAVISAGYSNGAVAVWNLNSKSPLLTGTKGGCRALLPVHRIYIPDSCITALDLHYNEDSRYLVACNSDRRIMVYDLHTSYLPSEVCNVNTRSKVSAACWNLHFPVIALAFDDVYSIDRCALTFHQPREIGIRLSPVYTFSAEATDMSANDWLSNHLVGTDGGDVICHEPTAYVYFGVQKNTAHTKYILTSTVSLKTTDETTDTSYAAFEGNFGLLFSDNDKNPSKMDVKSLQAKSHRRALLHEYPGIRVSQVRWNPNEKTHHYYAIGYQAGFVRVRGFRMK